MNLFTKFLIFALIIDAITSTDNACNQLNLSDGHLVCVCNATYCDTVPELQQPNGTSYQLYTTTRTKLGFTKSTGDFQQSSSVPQYRVLINRQKTYQRIVGFGGTFTDSTGLNLLTLPQQAQEYLLESYFGHNGVGYSLCRVPIGGTDFSTRPYTYDDHPNDTTLDSFALQHEDFVYKIPLIRKAQQLRDGTRLTLLSSVWSAPTWMKTNHKISGTGRLKREFYHLWAEYFLKFFRAYRENGIDLWATTVQNEPTNGLFPFDLIKINSVGWTPAEMNDFIGTHLGPSLKKSEFKDIKIVVHDESSYTLPLLPLVINNETTLNFTDGVALHWYTDKLLPHFIWQFARTDKKDLFIINTEASYDTFNRLPFEPIVDLGSWRRAQGYIESILNYLEFGSIGWIDWNLILDRTGGPSIIDNNVDAPVIVDGDVFYKQPMFYGIGHFSKFILPDSVRVDTTINGVDGVQTLAFLRPDNLTAVIIYNKNSDSVVVEIQDGVTIRINIAPQSINTVIY